MSGINSQSSLEELSHISSKNSTTGRLLKTKWAITRINEYEDMSKTYEIMMTSEKKLLDEIPEKSDMLLVVMPTGEIFSYKTNI
jgi:abortive infection bacteriophage resistance protein